ncbi:unnamed protein product [Pocillopora meandrina]|uniref:Uncharacterized protein n=1 Tax=Pocillopora meandrina TaxID=46732 RepID=A0AAU9WEL0_9CNID|nr:unnamed protein product [Pocillopora meandrina]
MFDGLAEDGSKDNILTLKSYTACHKKKGIFDEAMTLFKKAEQVAERELGENHEWKENLKSVFEFSDEMSA